MTTDERKRYGLLLYVTMEEVDTGIPVEAEVEANLPPWLIEKHADYAELFMTAAGLVPLAEVKDIVEGVCAADEDSANLLDVTITAIGQDICAALDERFGKEE